MPIKPIQQQAAGKRIHIKATFAWGAQVIKPFFVDPGETMTAKYKIRMRNTDILRRRATIALRGGKFYLQQHLASLHTAKIAKEIPAENGVASVPWIPSGADCSTLEIYANTEINSRNRTTS